MMTGGLAERSVSEVELQKDDRVLDMVRGRDFGTSLLVTINSRAGLSGGIRINLDSNLLFDLFANFYSAGVLV
jgi:hypothetical protein